MYYSIEGYIRNMILAVSWGWYLNAPLYTTALITSGSYLNSSLDTAGYVRIPRIASLPTYISGGNDFSWHTVSDPTKVDYTSLFGIPVAGLPEQGNTTFNIASHYWSINCSDWKVIPGRTARSLNSNVTFDLQYQNGSLFQFASVWYNSTEELGEEPDMDQGMLTSQTLCMKKVVAVESKVACEAQACAVREMRMLNRTNILEMGDSFTSKFTAEDAAFKEITKGILSATESNRNIASSDIVEHWLWDPNLGAYQMDLNLDNLNIAPLQWIELSKLPIDAFNPRLEMAINTY